jgi:hypothetical protein
MAAVHRTHIRPVNGEPRKSCRIGLVFRLKQTVQPATVVSAAEAAGSLNHPIASKHQHPADDSWANGISQSTSGRIQSISEGVSRQCSNF